MRVDARVRAMIPSVRTTALAITLFIVLGAGCAKRDLEWSVAFDPASLTDQAARLDVRILRGACPGTEALWDATIHPSRPTDDAPDIAPGTYCLAAQAGDVTCQWIGFGEQTVVLPTDDPVVVTITPMPSGSNCMGGTCQTDGTCSMRPPTGPPDCALGRCEQTCTDDCTASCLGGNCAQTCTGGAAVDCNFSCDGGDCIVTCEDGGDCNASCASGGCTMQCLGTVTDCVFDCIGGGCTFICDDLDDCATSCSAGGCTGP